jgi:DNA-binding transcriptional LysR family regulator
VADYHDLETILALTRTGKLADAGERAQIDDCAVFRALHKPLLPRFKAQYPMLSFDLHSGNEFASLTRRDADIALRATTRPRQQLTGSSVSDLAQKALSKTFTDVSN